MYRCKGYIRNSGWMEDYNSSQRPLNLLFMLNRRVFAPARPFGSYSKE